MKLQRTRRGWRITEGDAVLSEVLASPGPTQSVFDLLAATVPLLSAGSRIAVLGFAGGGMIAPLRAMGWDGRVEAVDLDPRGERLFRDISREWCGQVRFHQGDACRWLSQRRGRFSLIVDDLSVQRDGEITKPSVSYEKLPALMRSRLGPGGIAVINALPVPGLAWWQQSEMVTGPHRQARQVRFDDYENRVILAGERLPPARQLGRGLRGLLGGIGSRIAGAIAVREPAT